MIPVHDVCAANMQRIDKGAAMSIDEVKTDRARVGQRKMDERMAAANW
jgi:signal transduction histidine kinase